MQSWLRPAVAAPQALFFPQQRWKQLSFQGEGHTLRAPVPSPWAPACHLQGSNCHQAQKKSPLTLDTSSISSTPTKPPTKAVAGSSSWEKRRPMLTSDRSHCLSIQRSGQESQRSIPWGLKCSSPLQTFRVCAGVTSSGDFIMKTCKTT